MKSRRMTWLVRASGVFMALFFAALLTISLYASINANGDLLATKGADAVAGISGHTNATDCTVSSVAYTACASYDNLYGPLVTRVTNVLGQQTNLNYTTDGGNPLESVMNLRGRGGSMQHEYHSLLPGKPIRPM